MPPGQFENKRVTYSRRWKYSQQSADHVWTRVIKDYLPTLLPRQKWLKRTAPLKVGQKVRIFKDLTPRGLWPVGRISSIDDNDTQQPRQYEVKTKTRTFKIPAIRLAPRETEERLHQDDDSDEDEPEANSKQIEQQHRTEKTAFV